MGGAAAGSGYSAHEPVLDLPDGAGTDRRDGQDHRCRLRRRVLTPARRGSLLEAHRRYGRIRLCRHDGHDGTPDLDLVAFLQMLGGAEAAPIERGAVGRAEVLDEPQAVSDLETGVVTGSELVADGEVALAACGEGGAEAVTLVSDLDDQWPGGGRLDEGPPGLCGDGGHSGFPGLLLLLGGVLPRRQRCGMGAAGGFIGGSCEVFEAGAGHSSIMSEDVMTSGGASPGCPLEPPTSSLPDCPGGAPTGHGRGFHGCERAASSAIMMPVAPCGAVTGAEELRSWTARLYRWRSLPAAQRRN